MTRRRRLVLAWFALVVVGAACGSDDDRSTTPGPVADTVANTGAAPGSDGTGDPVVEVVPSVDAGTDGSASEGLSTGDAAPGPAALPSLPDPAPALACDGTAVLCVDGTTPEGGIGTADRPLVSIREAIALAGPGSTIQVASGTYAEPIILDQVSDVSIVGGFAAGGDFAARDASMDVTVLHGTNDASVVSITRSNDIHLEGFRITGGGGSTDGYGWFGGGVHVDAESSAVAIVGNRIDTNAVDHGDDPTATVGGGIATSGTEVSIVRNVIEGNRAGRGSGISAVGGSTSIEGNVVRDNASVGDHGGGIYAAGAIVIAGNRVEGNRVGEALGYGWGGGIIVFGDDTTAALQGNVVTGNLAVAAGSGVFVDDGADATLVDELYTGNLCTVDGGTQLLLDTGGETATVAELRHVTIASTDCPDAGNGGAVLAAMSDPAATPCSLTISTSILWGNGGDDLKVSGCEVTVSDSVVEQPLDPAVDGGGNLAVDPQFVDPGSGDFSLDPASPATGRGAGGTTP